MINLQKGQKIDLRKSSGEKLTNFCVGVNWGAIQEKAFFGLTTKNKSVDLDLSCILIDENGEACDHIYSPLYDAQALAKIGLPAGKLVSIDGALSHSGDDLAGDEGGDDGLDNEIITVDLNKINSNVSKIFFFLNNVGAEDFSQIPSSKIRMYEGTPKRVNSVFASYNVSAEASYKNKRALILGKLYKRNDEWKFDAIGDATDDVNFAVTISRILNDYK